MLLANPKLDLCLDFANTLYGRGSVPTELLHGFDDLVGWCVGKGCLSSSEAAGLLRRSRGNPDLAAEMFARAIEIRESVYKIFGRVASSHDAEPSVLSSLKRALSDAPARIALAPDAEGFAWRIDTARTTAPELLAPVIWSAGDLLTGKYLKRVRLCANQKCLWLFLDDSLGGVRRWCSMRACGNRAKTQRHYLRRRAS